MGSQTPNFALPYPAGGDTPDVVRDMQALANRLDTLLGAIPAVPISGLWQSLWPVIGTSTGSAYAIGTTFVWRASIPYAFTNMLWNANSVTANSTFRVGIYADTPTGPGALLVQTADLVSSTTAVQTAALAWTGGMCWVGVQQVGSAQGPFNAIQGISPWGVGVNQPGTLGANLSGWSAAGQGSVMPNPFPSSGVVKGATASALPLIYLQAA